MSGPSRGAGGFDPDATHAPAVLTPPDAAPAIPDARPAAPPRPVAPPATCNAFTVDVEEWFHILGANAALPVERWATMESRVEHATQRLLDMFEARGAKGTFFVLGWVADRHPALVREIAARGHEVASHGYHHALIYDQTPDQFRADVSAAKRRTEDITGEPVLGYRAPGFSVRRDTLWALDVLLDEGFTYDSSIMPAAHGHGGLAGLDDRPQYVATPSGARIAEFPLGTYHVGRRAFPFSGGGYLRLLPVAFLSHAIRAANGDARAAAARAAPRPVTMYLHPREIDPDQPRLEGLPLHRHFKYYVGLAGAARKVDRLLRDHPFAPLRDLHRAHFGARPS